MITIRIWEFANVFLKNRELCRGRIEMVYHCKLEKENGMYIVQFPDMPNIQTFGKTKEEALVKAKEALDAVLEIDISRGLTVPAPLYKEGYPIIVANR